MTARVLDVDDDQALAEMLGIVLRKEGYEVATCGDGARALPMIRQFRPDLVLLDDDPEDVLVALRLSRATYRKMRQNLAWATGYNAVALPLAAGVLAWAGFVISPAVGAVLMSASTIVVAINATLLRRTELT